MSMDATNVRKIVVVGDGTVGKTCLLMCYSGKPFDPVYAPTIFDNYTTEVEIGGHAVTVSLWDTAGQEEYDKIRTMSYVNVDCFLVCFSVADNITYRNVKERWIPELNLYSKDTPVVLVGTKEDLREQGEIDSHGGRTMVAYEEGKNLKTQINAYAYLECSALTGNGVKAVFDTAIRVILGQIPPPRKPEESSRRTCELF